MLFKTKELNDEGMNFLRYYYYGFIFITHILLV